MTVNFSNLFRDNEQQTPDKISVTETWQLELYGEPGDCFAVFLQSKEKTSQIAPLNAQGCDCEIAPFTNTIIYPQHCSLSFETLSFKTTEDDGWRRFIIIKAKYLPLPAKDLKKEEISSQDLERFAQLLLTQKDNQVSVETREFILVD